MIIFADNIFAVHENSTNIMSADIPSPMVYIYVRRVSVQYTFGLLLFTGTYFGGFRQ